jgi:hypothetical protein
MNYLSKLQEQTTKLSQGLKTTTELSKPTTTELSKRLSQGLPKIEGFQGLPKIEGFQGLPKIEGFQGLPKIEGFQGLPKGMKGLMPSLPTRKGSNPKNVPPDCNNLTNNIKKTNAVANEYCQIFEIDENIVNSNTEMLLTSITPEIPVDKTKTTKIKQIKQKYIDICKETLKKELISHIEWFFRNFLNHSSRRILYDHLSNQEGGGVKLNDFQQNKDTQKFNNYINNLISKKIKELILKEINNSTKTPSFNEKLDNYLTTLTNDYINDVIEVINFEVINSRKIFLESLDRSDFYLKRDYFYFLHGGNGEDDCYKKYAEELFKETDSKKIVNECLDDIKTKSTKSIDDLKEKQFHFIFENINNEIYYLFKADCFIHLTNFTIQYINNNNTDSFTSVVPVVGGNNDLIKSMKTISENNESNITFYYDKLIDKIFKSKKNLIYDTSKKNIRQRYNIGEGGFEVVLQNSPFINYFKTIINDLNTLLNKPEIQEDKQKNIKKYKKKLDIMKTYIHKTIELFKMTGGRSRSLKTKTKTKKQKTKTKNKNKNKNKKTKKQTT